MRPEEADKIIAEFMGLKHNMPFVSYKDSDTIVSVEYSQSLDALVPVWEKLTGGKNHALWDCLKNIIDDDESIWSISGNFTQAAAIATAKAIKEIK